MSTKYLGRLATLLLFVFALSTCGGGEAVDASDVPEAEEVEMDAELGPEYTSAYVCPMHCDGSGSAEPGKCPVCGMDYVMNEEKAGEDHGHDHGDHDHDGHDHDH